MPQAMALGSCDFTLKKLARCRDLHQGIYHGCSKPHVGRRNANCLSVRAERHNENKIQDLRTQFRSLLSELEYWVDDAWVEGTIPMELTGTYFRNGPGLLVKNSVHERHVFDGDGMIFSLAFKDGRAFFRNKFVKTKGFLKEQETGKPIFRNAFTSGSMDESPFFNPFDLNFKNLANTCVLHWAGKLYALWENGRPYELDPRTLDTVGESLILNDVLSRSAPLAAHSRLYNEADGSRRWVTFSMSVGNPSSIQFVEVDEAGACVAESRHVLEGVTLALVHDFAVTENYYVIILGSMEVDIVSFLTEYMIGQCSVAQCLKYNEKVPSRVMLYPRPGRSGLGPISAVAPKPFFSFHHVNAYEEPSGSLVIDTIAWREVDLGTTPHNITPDHFEGGQRTEYVRIQVDVSGGSRGFISEQRRLMDSQVVEFPVISPAVVGRRHSYAYCVGDIVRDEVKWGPFQSVVKVCLPQGGSTAPRDGKPQSAQQGVLKSETYEPGPRSFVGEPMFVPRPGALDEDDGWIIVGVHNAESMLGEIHILDAQRLSSGPVALLRLPHHLPASLHGSFSTEYLGPDPEDTAVPKWREVARYKGLM